MDFVLDITTVLFFLLTFFLLWILYSVLGQKNSRDHVSNRTFFNPSSAKDLIKPSLGMIQVADEHSKDRAQEAVDLEAIIEPYKHKNEKLYQELKIYINADPNFRPEQFVESTKAVYELVLSAFARKDRAMLQRYLSNTVYEEFNKKLSISEQGVGSMTEYTLVKFNVSEMDSIQLDSTMCRIKMLFVTDLMKVERSRSDENAKEVQEIYNVKNSWTFAKPLKTQDPNWQVVEIT